MTGLIQPVLIIGGIGAVCGIILAFVAHLMTVPVDEKIEKIKVALPGANCGACGFPGCDGYAHAVAAGEAALTSCPPGGQEVVLKLSEILGINPEEMVPEIGVVHCRCCDLMRMEKLNYQGALSCTYASQMYGGSTACFFACQGYGDCVDTCKYDAIRVINGLAVIDSSLCVGCALCVSSCPKGLIQMAPARDAAIVLCSNRDWGPQVQKVCTIGCVGCSVCEKTCSEGAVVVENFLAKIDYEKCTGCGKCATACPKGIIYHAREA